MRRLNQFWEHIIAHEVPAERPAVRPIETNEEEDHWQLNVENDHEHALSLEPGVRSIPKPKHRLDNSERGETQDKCPFELVCRCLLVLLTDLRLEFDPVLEVADDEEQVQVDEPLHETLLNKCSFILVYRGY